MSDQERRYEVEILPFGSLDLEQLREEGEDGRVDLPQAGRFRPVDYSLDVIHRLIERLQEL